MATLHETAEAGAAQAEAEAEEFMRHEGFQGDRSARVQNLREVCVCAYVLCG